MSALRKKVIDAMLASRTSTRVLVLFIIASVVPLYALLYLSDQANTQILKTQQLENLTSRSVSLAAQIDDQLLEWSRASDRVSRSPAVHHLFDGDAAPGPPDLQGTLAAVTSTDPSTRVAFLMDTSGQVVESSDPALTGSKEFASSTFFKDAAAGDDSISALSIGHGAPVPVLYVSAPVRDALGKVQGVAALRTDPQRIFNFFDPHLLGGSRFGLLVDQNGIVIGATESLRGKLLYRSLAPLNDVQKQQAESLAGSQIQQLGMPDLAERTDASSPGSLQTLFRPTGESTVFGIAPVRAGASPGSHVQLPAWAVAIGQPEEVFLAPARQQTQNTVTYTTLVAALFVLVIFLLARMFERTEQRSLTDSLTGLPNRRYFQDILERELVRSDRNHRPMSLINVDLDHFKAVNDDYGHSKGDEILRGFAQVLKEQVRSIDLPVRLGGEEFLILLPDTDKEGAVLVAEKVRRATDRLSIPRLGSMPGRRVTASLGVATYPLDATDGEQLLRCSDQAMYLAKNLGRNQVIGYGMENSVQALAQHPERVHMLVQNANKATIEALAAAVDARDTYTHGHSHRVADYSRIIAAEVENEPVDMETLHLAALLHDIGKIGISDMLLRKPGKLSSEEYEVMKGHAQIGYEMIQGVDFLKNVGPIILHHHENFDGRGYPRGLAGKDIPVESRIIMVADTFDAMTSTRTYRKGGSIEASLEELHKHAGRQFDPDIVAALAAAVKKGKMRLVPQPPPTAAQLAAEAARAEDPKQKAPARG